MSSPHRWSEFGREMSRQLDELRAGSGVAPRVRTRLGVALKAPSKGPVRSWALIAVAAVTILAVLSVRPFWMQKGAPLRAYRGMDESEPLGAGARVHGEDGQALLRFPDSAEFLLEPRASMEIADIDGGTARLALDRGRAHVSVVPDRGADYRISAGPFEVQVKGTRFRLGWDPANDRFDLVLYEGRVLLSGCSFGVGFAVAAGQQVRASCHDPVFEVKPIASGSKADAEVNVPSTPSAAATAAGDPSLPPGSGPRSPDTVAMLPPITEPPSWVGLARHGHRKEAWARIRSQGVENAILHAAPAELILLGDTARGVGELVLARRLYQLVRSRAPGSHSAAFAAFALGRQEFDDRGAFREAAQWFGTYLKEEPRGDLAREARGRLMESLHRGGSESAARQMADEYLRLHPRGPHSKLAAQLARAQEPHR